MKIKSIILIILTILISCDPENTITQIIKNESQIDIAVVYYYTHYDNSASKIAIDSVFIKSSSKSTKIISDHGSVISPAGLCNGSDSILVVAENNQHLLTYLVDTEEKNIYKDEYWEEKKISRRDYEYTFIITDEDLGINAP